MDSVIIKVTSEKPTIIVCDLEIFDWLELANGTVLVDYKYLMEQQIKAEADNLLGQSLSIRIPSPPTGRIFGELVLQKRNKRFSSLKRNNMVK